jgi:hypothetical protein
MRAITRTSSDDPTPSHASDGSSDPDMPSQLQPSLQDSMPSNSSIIVESSTDDPTPSHLSSGSSADTQVLSQPTSQGSTLSNTSTITASSGSFIHETQPISQPPSQGSALSNVSTVTTPSGSYVHHQQLTSKPVSQESMSSHPVSIWRPAADTSTCASSSTSAHCAHLTPQDVSPSNQSTKELVAAGKAQLTSTDSTSLASTAEPGKEWKTALRKGIDECILPLYTKAWEYYEKILQEIPKDDVVARKRVAEYHQDVLQRICHRAEVLYQDQVEEERQQLVWMQGGVVDREWLEGLVRQQNGILELAWRSSTSGFNDDSDGQSSSDSDRDSTTQIVT